MRKADHSPAEIEAMIDEELGSVDAEPMTAEEIAIAKDHCVCGSRMDDHDAMWMGHAPVSMFDYYEMDKL